MAEFFRPASLSKYLWIGILLVSGLFLTAQNAAAGPDDENYTISVSQRNDNLQWNIAWDIFGGSPNILSELTWRNVNILQVGGTIKRPIKHNSFVIGELKYGFIQSGQCQDSDYNGNNRTGEFSRSYNTADGDNTLDVSGAIGFYLTPPTDEGSLSLLAGLSYNQQNFRMTNGNQVIASDPNDIGPISGLNSTYHAQWKSFWVGLNHHKSIGSRFIFYSNCELHIADYYGVGNWNLRSDFVHPVSFEHIAGGSGFVLAVGLDYLITPASKLQLKVDYTNWSTGYGTDETFLADGSSGYTRLNGVNWNSTAVTLMLITHF